MLAFPDLALPEAWKPLFRTLDNLGWELIEAHGPQADWHCRELLCFAHQSGLPIKCFLSFLEEPEWCGNNFNGHAMTIAAIAWTQPHSRALAEVHCLPMTGEWESELEEFAQELEQGFFAQVKAAGIGDFA